MILTEHLSHCRCVPSESRATCTRVWVRSCMQYVPPPCADRRLMNESIWSFCRASCSSTSEEISLISNLKSLGTGVFSSVFKFEPIVVELWLLGADIQRRIL